MKQQDEPGCRQVLLLEAGEGRKELAKECAGQAGVSAPKDKFHGCGVVSVTSCGGSTLCHSLC